MAQFADRYANYKKSTIKLECPFKNTLKNKAGEIVEEIEINELEIRMPDAEDLEDFDLTKLQKVGSYFPLLAKLTGTDVFTIKKLQLPDLMRLVGEFRNFLPSALAETLLTSLIS